MRLISSASQIKFPKLRMGLSQIKSPDLQNMMSSFTQTVADAALGDGEEKKRKPDVEGM